MIQKIIHRILHRRHFWRHATFSEIAELYASRMLRVLALNMTAAFASIYLYQLGYDIIFIGFFWAIFYGFKFVFALPTAAAVAWIGPKHSILISNILFIPAMICLSLLDYFGPVVLVGMVVFQGLSVIMYQIAYNVDFSKIKSVEHASKEIAYMNILEKLTAGLSPLIGGLLAFAFGPEVVIIIAALLFAVAAIPLLRTAETMLPHQKVVFRGFPWRLVRSNVAAELAIGFDVVTSGVVWTLFTAIFIIGIESNNEIYAANGILLSVVFLAALAASYTYGRLIDRRKGKELMLFGAIANALTHLLRPFTGSPVAIAGLNIANEAATTAYAMPYTRGIFDNADLSGNRTLYVGVIEMIANLGASVAALLLALLAILFDELHAMEYFFYVAAAVVLLVATARFPLYRK